MKSIKGEFHCIYINTDFRIQLSSPMVFITATSRRSRLRFRASSWKVVWRSDRSEQVRVEKGRRMERVRAPTEGVETPGGKRPTITGENVSCSR